MKSLTLRGTMVFELFKTKCAADRCDIHPTALADAILSDPLNTEDVPDDEKVKLLALLKAQREWSACCPSEPRDQLRAPALHKAFLDAIDACKEIET